jgi:hypothetical protein
MFKPPNTRIFAEELNKCIIRAEKESEQVVNTNRKQ